MEQMKLGGNLRRIPIAKNSDPETSHESARLTDACNRARDLTALVQWVRMHPGRTAMELCQIMIDDGMPFYRVLTMHKRLSDAKQVGLVEQAGERACIHTGRKAGTWKVA